MTSAQSGQAGIQGRKISLQEEKSRLATQRPELASEYAAKKAELEQKAKDIDAKRVEALAEDKGVEGTGKEGRGPVYRQRMGELNLLQNTYKIADERAKDAQKRLTAVEIRIAAIDRELATIDGDRITPAIASPGRSPVTPEVAHTMRDIMVKVVNQSDGEGHKAAVPGYLVAGKTGTAQIACATCANGFDPTLVDATFVGFLPADEPRVSVLIKLDKVENFASQTAAPAFSKLAKRLVVIMNIPTDAQRQALRAQGGNTGLIAGR